MIDGSVKRNRWWKFEFQIPHVIERRSKREIQLVDGTNRYDTCSLRASSRATLASRRL